MFRCQVVGVEGKKCDRRTDNSKETPLRSKRRVLPNFSLPGKPQEHPTRVVLSGAQGNHPVMYPSYDASGSKHKRTEKEFAATMEPPRKKKRQGGKCKECLAAGVSTRSWWYGNTRGRLQKSGCKKPERVSRPPPRCMRLLSLRRMLHSRKGLEERQERRQR